MTLDDAREHAGRGVTCTPPAGEPEDGVITGTSATMVLVRYGDRQQPQATCPADLTLAPDGTGDEIRVRIHAHLRLHPGLTAFEIARALHLDNPGSSGQTRVRRHLRLMENDGEAQQATGPRCEGDPRPTARWTAT